MNYWTIYNSWFYLIALSTYSIIYPEQLKNAWHFLLNLSFKNRLVLISLAIFAIAISCVWLSALNGIRKDQDNAMMRSSLKANCYTPQTALLHKQEIRRFTTELFNPNIDVPIKNYYIINPMHNARYIGLSSLPLLLVLLAVPWTPAILWSITCLIGVLIICLASPFMLALWQLTPGMDRIVHQFYFYSHYLQLMVLVTAAAVFDAYFAISTSPDSTKKLKRTMLIAMGTCILGFIYLSFVSPNFPANDTTLQRALYSLINLLIISLILYRLVIEEKPLIRRFFSLLFLILVLADLGTYFVQVNDLDQKFTNKELLPTTVTYLNGPVKLAYDEISNKQAPDLNISKIKNILSKPWNNPVLTVGFTGNLFQNMPIFNSIWPINGYIVPCSRKDFDSQPYWLQEQVWKSPPLLFSKSLPVFSSEQHSNTFPGFTYSFKHSAYNDFSIQVKSPSSGWILLKQLPDKHWCLSIDGIKIPYRIVNGVENGIANFRWITF